MEILIDSVTPGLNRIDAQFHTGNSDLFSFVRSESADSVFLTDTSISILGSPIIAPGGVLATLYYSVYLTTDSVADIGLSDVKLNGFDPAYQECVALAEGVGTRFDYQYYCGQHILADYLRGHLDLRLNSIKPNPTTDRLTIDLSSERNGVVDIDVIDVIGKLVVRERHLLHRGDQTISVNTRSLPSGSYLLQLNTYGSTIRREFLKLR